MKIFPVLKVFISSKNLSFICYARLCAGYFYIKSSPKENFPIKSKRTIFPAIRRKNGSVNPVLSGLTSIWFKQLTWIKIHVPLKYMPNFTAIIQNWMQNFMYIQLKLNFSQNIILYNFTIWNNYSRSDLPCRQSFLILFCSQIIDTFFITNSLLCLRTIKQSFTIALLSAFLLRLFHQIFYFLK